MKTIDIVYVNNNLIGYYNEDKYIPYSKEQKEKLFLSLEKKIIKSDVNRKKISLVIGLIMLFSALTIAFLMVFKVIKLGESQIFNYTILIAFLVFLWIVLYYLLGFIFYKKIVINYSFKSKKVNNYNSSVMYASSNYYKFVNQYSDYLQKTNFVINKEKKKQNVLVPFCMYKPSFFKNIIFNGKICSNVPYFYLSFDNKRLLFLPAMIILVDGKHSKVLDVDCLKVEEKNKTYLLYLQDKLVISFNVEGIFNKNFFYFKYEQL